MDTVKDFEDLLMLLDKHGVRYLIVGGLAFIFHAKPRFTKDMDLWVDPVADNIARANAALAEFGSPYLLEAGQVAQVLQLGLPPNRVDMLQTIEGLDFAAAWQQRETGAYGAVQANWIDLESLLAVKAAIDDPRHQSDARYLRKVKEMREQAQRAEKDFRPETASSGHGVKSGKGLGVRR